MLDALRCDAVLVVMCGAVMCGAFGWDGMGWDGMGFGAVRCDVPRSECQGRHGDDDAVMRQSACLLACLLACSHMSVLGNG